MSAKLQKEVEELREKYHTKEPEVVGLAKACILSSRLRYVNRYSVRPVVRNQNVMEHCGGVSTLGCLFLVLETSTLDLEEKFKILVKLNLHDFHELATGDVIYPVKRFDKSTEAAYNKVTKSIMSKVMSFIKFSSGTSITHNKTLMSIFTGEASYENKTFADAFVEFFDRLEMLVYIAEEGRLGNRNLHGMKLFVEKMLLDGIFEKQYIENEKYTDLIIIMRQLASSIMSHNWQVCALEEDREDYV